MFYVADERMFNYVLGFLNSKIPPVILKSLNPTLSILTSDIMNLPFIYEERYVDEINTLVEENIRLSTKIYSEYEEHWQFEQHPLLGEGDLKTIVKNWIQENFETRCRVLSNEKKLNTLFADILDLRDTYDWSEDCLDKTTEDIAPNPQSPIPNPQSPIPNPQWFKIKK